ncbi:cuticle protein AM1159-like [Macrobrachium nipponense]|uniref:cuticle protein AM1159-like n=1 Tax=Macrobrachium nipponense TaxID=159736 RepID=UPI0030C7A302
MKFILLACASFCAAALAAPQIPNQVVAITRDDRTDNGDGTFTYAFEAENGIVAQAAGVRGALGQSNIQGVYSYPLPDGSGVIEVRYVADENGFRAESPFLPQNPPHVAQLLRIAEEQRAAGITFE